jgi:hypothetical protein
MLYDDAHFLINCRPRFTLSYNGRRITIAGHGKCPVIHLEGAGLFYFYTGVKQCDRKVKTAFTELRKALAGGVWTREYLQPAKRSYSPRWTGD